MTYGRHKPIQQGLKRLMLGRLYQQKHHVSFHILQKYHKDASNLVALLTSRYLRASASHLYPVNPTRVSASSRDGAIMLKIGLTDSSVHTGELQKLSIFCANSVCFAFGTFMNDAR
jgi:hypothetical protein